MLQLVANSEERTSASIPIRWCVGEDTVRTLFEQKAKNPHLLLIVVSGRREVDRKLVPLDQLMEFIQFHEPGHHRVYATIVWDEKGDPGILGARVFGGRAHGQSYARRLCVDREGNFITTELGMLYNAERAEIDVEVAADLFAKPPSWFEKWWVNFWFEAKPRDQCQFRRRRILAYSLQPPLVLLWWLAKTIVRLFVVEYFLSIGQRGINFAPLMHPWRLDLEDIYYKARDEERGTIFTKTKDGKDISDRLALVMPFAPIVWEVLFTAGCLLTLAGSWKYGVLRIALGALVVQAALSACLCFLWVLFVVMPAIDKALKHLDPYVTMAARWAAKHAKVVVPAGLLVFAGLFATTAPPHVIGRASISVFYLAAAAGAIWGLGWILAKLIDAHRPKSKEEKIVPAPETPDQVRERSLQEFRGMLGRFDDALICRGPVVAKVGALPPKRRTVHLRFQNLKARVCKPFPS